MRKKNPYRVYDWMALRAEFMKSNESLNSFRKRHKMPLNRHYYSHVEGWKQQRLEMKQRAAMKAFEKQEQAYEQEYAQTIHVLDGIEAQCAAILNERIGANGRIETLEPSEVLNVVRAIHEKVKTLKLIKGEPTERTETPNIHLQIVQVLQAIKRGEIQSSDDGPPSLTS